MALHYRNVYWLWLSLAVIVVDQITKQWVVRQLELFERIPLLDVLNLVYVRNTGAAFSMLEGASPLFFIALGIVVSIGIMVWLRLNPTRERPMAVGLSLILGGALGNVIDRAARGYVVDFIDFHLGAWHWPAFNVADIAVTVGAVLLVIDAFWPKRRAKSAA